jgi:hypothetical protein
MAAFVNLRRARQALIGPVLAFRPCARSLGDLAIGIDASEIDGPVWSVSDRETAGPLDRVAQIAERKYCRSQARPFRLGFPRKVPVFPICSPAAL